MVGRNCALCVSLCVLWVGCKDPKPVDRDGDGWSATEDCDDADAAVYPGAAEICDEQDNNCDGAIDEDVLNTFYADADADGYPGDEVTVRACAPPDGYFTEASDCDDLAAAVHPEASEVCDGVDNDCDGLTDDADDSLDPSTREVVYADHDGDGYGHSGAELYACTPGEGQAAVGGDCDDNDPARNPDVIWFRDLDMDGYGDPLTTQADCIQPVGFQATGTDCDDTDAAIHPGATEVCDPRDVDEDCDGFADDDDPSVDPSSRTDWFYDSDGDGYGADATMMSACDAAAGHVALGGDCDDSEPLSHPAVSEICDDGVDNDCSGDAPECGLQGTHTTATATVTLTGSQAYDYAGTGAAVADLDGDGVSDLVVGAYGYIAGSDWGLGHVGVWTGPIVGDGDLATADAEWVGGYRQEYVGLDIASPGDLDGDGFDDVLVGAYGDSSHPGAAHIVYGGGSLASSWSSAWTVRFQPDGESQLGYTTFAVGDLNGDGRPDWAQGVYRDSTEADEAGAVYLFLDNTALPTGTVSTETWSSTVIYGEDADGWLGARGDTTVAGSDHDGDGTDDLFTGTYFDGAAGGDGAVYLFYGGASWPTSLRVSDADLRLEAAHTDAMFGWSVRGGTDLDGDGYDDVVLSEPDSSSSTVYVLYGASSALSGTHTVSSVAGTTVQGASTSDQLGWFTTSGDVNADLHVDLIVTDPNYSGSAGLQTGAVFSFYGPLPSGGTWTSADANAVIEGAAAGMELGDARVHLLDHDSDGDEDLVVVARAYDSYVGTLFLFEQTGL